MWLKLNRDAAFRTGSILFFLLFSTSALLQAQQLTFPPEFKSFEEVKAVNSGPGLFIAEPVVATGSEDLTNFSSGCRKWLQYTMGDNPELGQMPGLLVDVRLKRELKSQNLQFDLARAVKAGNLVGVTHVAVGTLSGSATNATLTYRVYEIASQKPISTVISEKGSSSALVQSLPSIASKLLTSVGISKPHVPASLNVTPSDIAAIGICDWESLREQNMTLRGHIKSLSSVLPAAAYIVVCNDASENRKVALESARKLMELDPDNFYNVARLVQAGTDMVLPYEAIFKHNVQKFPNNSGYCVYTVWQMALARNPEGLLAAQKHCVQCSIHDSDRWAFLSNTQLDAAGEIRKGRTVNNITEAEWKTLNRLYEEALFTGIKAVKLDPLNAYAWLTTARAATFAGVPDIADTALWKGLAVDPSDYRFCNWGLQMYQPKWFGDSEKLNKVGRLLIESQDIDGVLIYQCVPKLTDAKLDNLIPLVYPAALARLKKQVTVKPDASYLHAAIGDVNNALKRYDVAIAELQEAIRLDPDYLKWHVHILQCYQDAKRYKSLLSESKLLMSLDPSEPDYKYAYGAALCWTGELAEGIKTVHDAVTMKQDPYGYYLNLATVLDESGHYALAELEAIQAYRKGSSNIATSEKLSRVLFHEEEYDGALFYAKRSLMINPRDGYVHYLLADIYAAMNKDEDAEREAQTCAEIDPENPLSHLQLGNILLKRGKKADARKEWELAASIKPPGDATKQAEEKLKGNP